VTLTIDHGGQNPMIETEKRVTWKLVQFYLRRSSLKEESKLLSKMMNRHLVLSKLHRILFGSVHTPLVEHMEILIVHDGELWSVPWDGSIYST